MTRLLILSATITTFAACSPNTSSLGQQITCETDPETGVVTRCHPSEDGDGQPGQCHDVDEDGDGQPSDDDDMDDDDSDDPVARAIPDDDDTSDTEDEGADDDHDGDGIPDDDDCDEQPGQEDDDADLPYDIKLALGATYRPVLDAFAQGAAPAEIVAVEMDGGAGYRLAELQAGTAFAISQADCSHAGNRAIGRDRVLVTWRKASGELETDHLDLRYCEQ